MNHSSSALLTDLYELTMAQAYLKQGMTGSAVFEFFVRKLSAHRNFLVAAGLEQVLDYLAELQVTQDELAWLDRTRRFTSGLLHYLETLQFTGDVDTMADGPFIRVGPRGRTPGLRAFCPRSTRQCRPTDRHVRYRSRCPKSRRVS